MGKVIYRPRNSWKRPRTPVSRANSRQKRLTRSKLRLLGVLSIAGATALMVQVATGIPLRGVLVEALTWVRPAGTTLIGTATVIDGDTIEIHGQRVRFNGIDAPETSQKCLDESNEAYLCGAKSAEFLQAFIKVSSPVRCEFFGWDRYDRFVGDCYRADGASLNEALVASGHALDWPRYSGGKYASFESVSRVKKLGLWQGKFQAPWDFRGDQGAALPTITKLVDKPSAPAACRIKGNVSVSRGEKIYHLPGQEHYARTRISLNKGERWFCSEAEARAAGWRKAKK